MGGAFITLTDTEESSKDDLSINAFDFIDLEGRLFLNKTNIAFLLGVNGGIGHFNDKDIAETLDSVTHVTAYAGAGYRFNFGSLSLIPSFVVSSTQLSSEKTTTQLGVSVKTSADINVVSLGGDIAAIYMCTKNLAIEASCLVTASVSADYEVKASSSYGTFSEKDDLKTGDLMIMPKLGLCWFF